MQVKEIMCTEIECIGTDMTIQDAAIMMKGDDIGCLPVVANGQIIGILTDRDIVCRGIARGLDMKTTLVGDIMTRGITTCLDDQDIDEVAALMEGGHVRRLPVIDHGTGEPVGVLSLGDLPGNCKPEVLTEILSRVTAHHGIH